MPVLFGTSSGQEEGWAGWSVVIRDHLLQHTAGLVLRILDAGVEPTHVRVYDKGDATSTKEEVTALLRGLHVRVGLLDNSQINSITELKDAEFERELEDLRQFLARQHDDGRKVLAIDDGGLIAQGFAQEAPGAPLIDAAIELTISGLQRIKALGYDPNIPILNLAESQAKAQLGYTEIASSCVRRLQDMLQADKLIGRRVVVFGFGSLGARISRRLRDLGCQVLVVDPDYLRLSSAAEAGFATAATASHALLTQPDVVVGASGAATLDVAALGQVRENTIFAPFATKDFLALRDGTLGEVVRDIPDWGVEVRLHAPGQAHCFVLGNGRSLNLFNEDSISPSGYDSYRAAAFAAATYITHHNVKPGLQRTLVDDVVVNAGVAQRHYETYCAQPDVQKPPRAALSGEALVIGAGVSGRIHSQALRSLGYAVTTVDPNYSGVAAWPSLASVPDYYLVDCDLVSICTPTPTHVSVLQTLLERHPNAVVFVEKPFSDYPMLESLNSLLRAYPQSKIRLISQYRDSAILSFAIRELATQGQLSVNGIRVFVEFSKDRREDERAGRFIDLEQGAVGYEWPHVLTVAEVLGPDLFSRMSKQTAPSTEVQFQHGRVAAVRQQFEDGESSFDLRTSSVSAAMGALPKWIPSDLSSIIATGERSGRGRRLAAVQCADGQVVLAQFAPGHGLQTGSVLRWTPSEGVVTDETIDDYPLNQHLRAQLLTPIDLSSVESQFQLTDHLAASLKDRKPACALDET